MQEAEGASVPRFPAGTVLVGRSEQEPTRDLAYVVLHCSAVGRLILERHGRDGFTGSDERFTEYGRKLGEAILSDKEREREAGNQDGQDLDAIVAYWNATWEVCTPATRRVCPVCRANGRPA